MMNDRKKIILIALYAIMIVAIHIMHPGDAEFYWNLTTAVNIVTAIIPIFIGLVAIRHFGISSLQGKSILFIVLMIISWLVADVIWTLSGDALVSAADIFYLAGYPLLMIAIVYGIMIIDPDILTEKKKILMLSLISVILVAAYFSFFTFSWDPEITFLENVLVGGYVVADILIIIPTLFLISNVLSGTFSKPWLFIAAANLLNLVGDIIYNINYETYAGGDPLDLTWYIAYLLYGAAFIVMIHETGKITSALKK
ncbi:MAG: hypothetical protein JW789_00025 [Candidatus Aenigmarchaeota archaeon]|nr:hypothetical protein [Candidatus Aenigmarchaeota archaeon]